MAEVTVWIEEDGIRTSISVEHADKQTALDAALQYAGYTKPVEVEVVLGEPVTFSSDFTVHPAWYDKRKQDNGYTFSRVNGKRDCDKVIKLAGTMGYDLTIWQREVIRAWFDK